MNPKICIVYNGGACGDFFTMLLDEQINDSEILINENGKVVNCPTDFKFTCKSFFNNKKLRQIRNFN